MLYFWYEQLTHTIKWIIRNGAVIARAKGFWLDEKERRNVIHQTTSADLRLETNSSIRDISRLFLFCQEPWISRYYFPSLFCMVQVYIIDVNMRIKLFTRYVSLSLFLFDCLGFNFLKSGYASNCPKVSEFVQWSVNCFCFSKHYLFVNDNITSMNYLKRKSYLPISFIMGVNS